MLKHQLERLFFSLEPVLTAVLYPVYLLRACRGRRVSVPILMYHQVGRAPEGARFCQDAVSRDRFEQQIHAILAAGYRVIPLATLVELLEKGASAMPKRSVVLTFDDGLRDQFVNACSILRQYGMPATFFLVAGYVGKAALLPHLSLEETAHQPSSGWRTLSWNEAEAMMGQGACIGCHSLSHRSLGAMSAADADTEVRISKEILERRLGIRVDLFAYPFGSQAYGDFDRNIQELLRSAGYRAACTTVVGTNGRGANPFALRRIPVEERDGPFRLRCKMIGAYDWVGSVKGRWQRVAAREDRVDAGSLAAWSSRGTVGS